jgi:hypothetical protein
MTIEGEYLGEPATLTVDGDRASLAYTIGARPAVCAVATIERRPPRLFGLGPFHGFAPVFAIGAYFARMPWLAIAFATAGIGHAIYRIARPPIVLLLDDKLFVVAPRCRDAVRLHAAR